MITEPDPKRCRSLVEALIDEPRETRDGYSYDPMRPHDDADPPHQRFGTEPSQTEDAKEPVKPVLDWRA